MGYVTPLSFTAFRTLSTPSSSENSGVVHADHDQPLFFVPRGPRAAVRQCTKPIDAGIGPEVDDTTLPLKVRRRRGAELNQAVALPIEAKSLALESRNGFTVIICITDSLVPIHAPASDSAVISMKRRRSCRGCANIHSCLYMKETAFDSFSGTMTPGARLPIHRTKVVTIPSFHSAPMVTLARSRMSVPESSTCQDPRQAST
jgi:hypothetical protein